MKNGFRGGREYYVWTTSQGGDHSAHSRGASGGWWVIVVGNSGGGFLIVIDRVSYAYGACIYVSIPLTYLSYLGKKELYSARRKEGEDENGSLTLH